MWYIVCGTSGGVLWSEQKKKKKKLDWKQKSETRLLIQISEEKKAETLMYYVSTSKVFIISFN